MCACTEWAICASIYKWKTHAEYVLYLDIECRSHSSHFATFFVRKFLDMLFHGWRQSQTFLLKISSIVVPQHTCNEKNWSITLPQSLPRCTSTPPCLVVEHATTTSLRWPAGTLRWQFLGGTWSKNLGGRIMDLYWPWMEAPTRSSSSTVQLLKWLWLSMALSL